MVPTRTRRAIAEGIGTIFLVLIGPVAAMMNAHTDGVIGHPGVALAFAFVVLERFRGEQIHSVRYRAPEPFAGKRVVVVGGGNSGAQILGEVANVAYATWVTLTPPTFLPDHMDGRNLFDQATARYRAQQEGRPTPEPASLVDIVMVEPVRAARERRVAPL